VLVERPLEWPAPPPHSPPDTGVWSSVLKSSTMTVWSTLSLREEKKYGRGMDVYRRGRTAGGV
jgi:hypothetical protein